MSSTMHSLMLDLHEIEAVKFGTFTLKSGLESPIYIDLRVIISYPKLLKKIASLLWDHKIAPLSFDLLCGVPYAALPLAAALSLDHNIPMVMRRKEVKDYGTKKMIEGVFKPKQKCLIIEDVVTSGASILEATESLRQAGLVVTDAIVVLDREQGGEKRLREHGIQLHSLLTLSEVVATLQEAQRISEPMAQTVKDFLLQKIEK